MRVILSDIWASHDTVARVAGHDIRYFNPLRYLDRDRLRPYVTADLIMSLHREGEPTMKAMLTAFRRAVHDFGAEALAAHQSLFPPEWLVENADPLIRTLGCFDDPQNTYTTTLPMAWAFHGLYYCSPSYSPTRRFADALAMFGIKHSHWFPLSLTRPTPELIAAVEASWSSRRLQALYIGKCYGGKVDKLALINRGLGGRFRIHGQAWPLCGLAGFVAPLRGRKLLPKWVRPIGDAQRRRLYLESLIGFNTHLGTGCETGNVRMYEAPMHGALLLSDKAGCDAHEDIFKSDLEAVYYGSTEEAIDKCLYYFRHSDKAIAIAKRGFVRARLDYSPEKVLGELFDWMATLRSRTAVAQAGGG